MTKPRTITLGDGREAMVHASAIEAIAYRTRGPIAIGSAREARKLEGLNARDVDGRLGRYGAPILLADGVAVLGIVPRRRR